MPTPTSPQIARAPTPPTATVNNAKSQGAHAIAPTTPTSPARQSTPAQAPPLAPPPAATAKAAKPLARASSSQKQQKVSAPPSSRQIRDIVEVEFGHEILLKHNELRLINQELAKCQIALEQLRRCHLMPYPVSCPTPAQMLDISAGKGPPLQKPGEKVPEWAPPFGVVDGPYARHYAKWLIPDPKFDGIVPASREPQGTASHGRSMRKNSVVGSSRTGKRGPRGSMTQPLGALPAGPPAPKAQAGPCIIKRSDGKVVKLWCAKCKRDNFSNTQGFLNHCRISHQAEYKSHDEAAMACGVDPDADTETGLAPPKAAAPTGNMDAKEKGAGSAMAPPASTSTSTPAPCARFSAPAPASVPAPVVTSRLVHPFNRPDMTEKQAYQSLLARLHRPTKPSGTSDAPVGRSVPTPTPSTSRARKVMRQMPQFTGAAETPYLTKLLQSKKFQGNLGALVSDAKTLEVDDDDVDMEDPEDQNSSDQNASDQNSSSRETAQTVQTGAPRSQGAMRMPARSHVVVVEIPQFPASKPSTPSTVSSALPSSSLPRRRSNALGDLMDLDMSDHEFVRDHSTPTNGHHAPSLVSDDGDYDDSYESSSESDTGDANAPEPVVAHISVDDDHVPSRGLQHHRSPSGPATAMTLKRDGAEPTDFTTPVEHKPRPTPKARGPGRPRKKGSKP
jgi:ADA HAT complex component 1